MGVGRQFDLGEVFSKYKTKIPAVVTSCMYAFMCRGAGSSVHMGLMEVSLLP